MNKILVLVGLLALLSNTALAEEDTTTTEASITTETIINQVESSSTTESVEFCDPNGIGTPDCQGIESSDERYRNNWDPAGYFICRDGEAVKLSCATNNGFDPVTQKCVPWSEWVWYAPCTNFEIDYIKM